MENNDVFTGKNRNVILKVEPYSIAEELGIEPGDVLLSVNFREVTDVFDYRFFITDEYIEVLIEKPDGDQWLLEIDKEENEDLGIIFENGLMDDAKSCKNKCLFCFIDQLPKGMRDTLYFKDDDSRLSFLQGNYITLTNMSLSDLDRMMFYRLSPFNISIHATDLDLRRFMLKNPSSDRIFVYLNKLFEAEMSMNFQIVLVKGLNDKEQLAKSITDLAAYMPHAVSLSIVPVGITRFRDGLYPLEPFSKADALEVIEIVEKYQNILYKEKGSRFVFASDEFYITAGRGFPDFYQYEGFPQLENGVGMASSFSHEVTEALRKPRPVSQGGKVTVVTGLAAFSLIRNICDILNDRYGADIRVCPVENSFFGEHITVSGLLTGKDIMEKLSKEDVTGPVLIPLNCLKNGEEVFLDDITVSDIEQALDVDIDAVSINGRDFVDTVLSF